MLRHKRHDETKEERGQLLGIHINTGRHRDDEQLVLLILEEEVFGVAFVGVGGEGGVGEEFVDGGREGVGVRAVGEIEGGEAGEDGVVGGV